MRADQIEAVLDGLDDRYLCEAAGYMDKKNGAGSGIWRKAGKAAAGIAAAVFLSFSGLAVAAASGNIPAYDLLYSLYPEVAKRLTPVNVSCEDNGIKMEVESVCVHGDTAEIYISMTDLMGNRIDETIDLFDSYRIHIAEDNIGSCSLIDYDPEKNTATFFISVQLMNGEKIEGQNLTFSVSEFLSGENEVERELPEISLETASTVTKPQTDVVIRGGSGVVLEEEGIDRSISFLRENTDQSCSLTDGVRVTGWGLIDRRLHIQVYYEDILQTDNHGYLYLMDEQGNEIHCAGSIAFWDEPHKGSYEEYIFDMGPEEDFGKYSVWGHFWICKHLTTGRWTVSFPVENRE